MIDTRRMEIAVLEIKRAQMIELLGECTQTADFNLRAISSLHGSLESLMRYIKWAGPLFFTLQNGIWLELMRRYHTLKRWYGNSKRISAIAHFEFLMFWFDIIWSVRQRLRCLRQTKIMSTSNSLEFIVVILQLAAVVVRLESLSIEQRAALFPSGIPAQPILLSLTNNTATGKWSNKVTSK
jgi:hypothetical protein